MHTVHMNNGHSHYRHYQPNSTATIILDTQVEIQEQSQGHIPHAFLSKMHAADQRTEDGTRKAL